MSDLIAITVDENSVLILGDSPALIERQLTRLTTLRDGVVDASGITVGRSADVAAVAAAAAAIGKTSGTYFRCLQPEVRDKLGRFVARAKFEQVNLGPEQALALANASSTLALRAAIADVQKAVERVEGKVDQILALAQAERWGGIVGSHRVLKRMTALLDAGQVLTEADWDSVAALGPMAEITTERVRDHARRVVAGLPLDAPADERAAKLHDAVDAGALGESLALLVVAEDALYQWQRLRLERIRTHEYGRLADANSYAREVLRDNVALDRQLVEDLYTRLIDYAHMRPLEVVRLISKMRLQKDQARLRMNLEEFVHARGIQIEEWPEIVQWRLRDAPQAVRVRSSAVLEAARPMGQDVLDVIQPAANRIQEQARDTAGTLTEQVRRRRSRR